MEGAYQMCRNCKRRMDSNLLALHEICCLTFLVLCPECKKPVLRDKMEEHRQGGHQQVGCAICQQSMPKDLLESHEAQECKDRSVECQFCHLAMRLNKVDLHEHHCGQQMEVCPDCGQHVMLRVLAQHREDCRREQPRLQKERSIPAPESNISCHYCNQMIPRNKYFHHLDRCCRVSGAVTHSPAGKPETPPSSPPSRAAEDQTSKAEKDVRPKMKNRHRAPFLSEKSRRQAPRSTNKTTNLSLTSNGKLRASSPVEDETAYDVLRRCSQCGILLPLPTLNHHQVPSLCSLHTQL